MKVTWESVSDNETHELFDNTMDSESEEPTTSAASLRNQARKDYVWNRTIQQPRLLGSPGPTPLAAVENPEEPYQYFSLFFYRRSIGLLECDIKYISSGVCFLVGYL